MAKSLAARSATAGRVLAPIAVCAALIVPGVPAQAAPAPAMVTVVHGVRGLVADVKVDGKLVLSGFAPERITSALPLPPGPHHIQAWPTGAATGAKPVVDTTLSVTAGSHVTLGIGLDSAGHPQVTPFNDNLPLSGTTAVAVRDIAAAPAVRVTLDNRTLVASIQPPQQRVANITPGAHAVAVLPLAGGAPLVPPQNVPIVAGRAMVLYLIGSAKDHSLGWVAQTLRPSAALAAPRTVQTGVGPLDGPSSPALPLWGGLVLVGAAAGVAVRRRLRRGAPAA